MDIDRIECELQKKDLGKKDNSIFMGTILILLFLILLLAGRSCFRAQEAGNYLGTTAGKIVGTAVGSYNALTEGIAAGAEAGKQQGLSAEDTEVKIGNSIKNIGKLDVLIAEGQIHNDLQEGNEYKALFVYKTNITFSVDLEAAEIVPSDKGIKIILPPVEMEFDINENESEKLAEWQKHFWSGSEEAGYTAYMNSMAKIKEKAGDEMENYGVLMEQAKDFAKTKVRDLAKSVYVSKKNIEVVFRDEEN